MISSVRSTFQQHVSTFLTLYILSSFLGQRFRPHSHSHDAVNTNAMPRHSNKGRKRWPLRAFAKLAACLPPSDRKLLVSLTFAILFVAARKGAIAHRSRYSGGGVLSNLVTYRSQVNEDVRVKNVKFRNWFLRVCQSGLKCLNAS